MVKILHTADLHLDSPFTILDYEKAKERKIELRNTFVKLVKYALDNGVNIVIISGDLFDMEYVTSGTISFICDVCSSAPDIKFVITPGNHDFYCNGGAYDNEFPSNMYIFRNTRIDKISFDDLETDIYGFAFTSDFLETDMLATRLNANRERLSIFACHADILSKDSKYCPITINDIANLNCDYVALGHLHKGSKVDSINGTAYAYPGCIEGRSFDECGKKYVIVGTFEKGFNQFSEYRWKGQFNYVRLCDRTYEKIDCDVTGCQTTKDLYSKMREEIQKQNIDPKTLLRITLKGLVEPNIVFNTEGIRGEDVGVYYLEIKNDTIPTLNNEELLNDISIKGVFYRELLPKLQSSDEKEREIARQALEYGMKALSGYRSSDL